MKRFTDYFIEQENLGNNKEIRELSEDVIFRICKVAWRKHRKYIERFIAQLADIDPEINSMLDDINADEGPTSPHDDDMNKDEVVPSDADGSPGLESGGEE